MTAGFGTKNLFQEKTRKAAKERRGELPTYNSSGRMRCG